MKIGECFNQYEIIRQIGAGGMGEVYLATDKKLDRQVAVKILNETYSRDESNLRRFTQEAKAVSALNHPNILVIHEIGEAGDVHFIVSEFVEGKTLREIISQSPLKLSEILDFSIQIANALSVAHTANIVHRDIKPENIIVRPDGYVKILDFGLAKLIGQQKSLIGLEDETAKQNNTAKGVILGTVKYMSPEQAKGERVDARTDIFSFGVLLYEMMAGRTPFAGDSMSETLANLINTAPQPMARYAEGVPNELQRIVSKMLRKNKDERYQTMKGLLADLKDLRENLAFDERLKKSYSPDAENATQVLQATTGDANLQTAETQDGFSQTIKRHKPFAAFALIVLLAAIGFGIWYFTNFLANSKQIESIAVLPFINESGNVDTEYLSDGMTESLISSLSQLPNLNVKARSSVFRYKGKDTNANTIGKELNVQAILNGRVVQRGQDLILYVELVDAATENSLWKQTYNKTMTNLVALQNDIARDVADKLKVKLSGADEQKLAKNYTANAEAYQLYLRGRYHLLKLTPAEIQTGISYFGQAIEIDSNYALAYAGLSEAYRTYAVAADLEPTAFLPKAKTAANKAIEIDDTLAEAHTVLGVAVFWGDWNWKEAENQYQRALELNPNNAEAHMYYAHLLSVTGQHTKALAEVKLARELEPLDLRINTLEAQFLIHAGRNDEALARLQETFKLDSNYWLAHSFAASAYIEKGMYAEAVAEARRARNLFDGGIQAIAFESYALAKSGKQAEARAVLEELLKLSTTRYVPAYHVALVYNGLNERDKTLAWLERAFEQHNPRMVFLKVEPKWNNLRDDPRFQDLLRKVGFPP